MTLLCGLLGGCLAYSMMWYTSVVGYPMNIGGRPFHSWPAFVPITFELTILFAALGTAIGMLILNGLRGPITRFSIPRTTPSAAAPISISASKRLIPFISRAPRVSSCEVSAQKMSGRLRHEMQRVFQAGGQSPRATDRQIANPAMRTLPLSEFSTHARVRLRRCSVADLCRLQTANGRPAEIRSL